MAEWKWTDKRLDKFADIFIGFGHVVISAVVIRSLFGEIPISWGVAGSLITLALWAWGLLILEKKEL